MRKKRSIVWRILPWVILLAALAALVLFVFVPIYSQKEDTFGEPPVVVSSEGLSGTLSMENDSLLFEMDQGTTQFTVTDKKTGKTWYSNPTDRASDPVAMGANKEALSSTLNVTYTFSGGEIEFNNYTYSIQNQTYQTAQAEDGSIRVDYAIGKIEKNYLIPNAITVERYKQFTDAMSKKGKKQVSSIYTLVEPDKLDKKDNKAESLELYPSAAEQAL